MKKLFKSIYKKLPFKKHFFQLIKVFGVPSQSMYQHLYFVGNYEVKVDKKKRFRIRHYGYKIENEIFWKGLYNGFEKVSLTIWSELSEKSEVIFDIGANTGIYCLVSNAINPNAAVYAFEPVKRVCDKLKYNNQLNEYNTTCIEKAISNFDGEATIYDKDSDHIYSVTVNADISKNKETSIPTTIETIRLDTFIETNNISKIDLLKVDVESHEIEALEGLGKYLKLYEPTFVMEILNDEIARGVEKITSDIGYDYYEIYEDKGLRKVDELRKNNYFNVLIIKPEIAEKTKSIQRFQASYK